MKIINSLPKGMVDDKGNCLDGDEEVLGGILREEIEAVFLGQTSDSDLQSFHRMLSEDSCADDILPKFNKFTQGENIRFASLELPPEYAKLIRKKKRKFGIKDLRQYGAQGDKVHLLLKREESGEKRNFFRFCFLTKFL